MPSLTVIPAEPPRPPTSYRPLALLVAYLVGGTLLLENGLGAWDPARAMRHFMAGFFLAFSYFKLLDVPAFATSYAMYDLVAARWRGWGLLYPFAEAGLGAAYLANAWPTLVNTVTLGLMLVSTAGVVRTLLAGRSVRCACLGTGFNLPMSTVTLVEDLLMAGMAAAMLAAGGHT